jgi:hypothetical protein
MFWQSVIDGFVHFFNWRILIVGASFALLSYFISYIVPYLNGLLFLPPANNDEADSNSIKSNAHENMGCFSMIMTPFIQLLSMTFLNIVVVLLITTIMVSGFYPSLNAFTQLFFPARAIGVIVFIITLILCLIPILNSLLDIPIIYLYIQGIIIFHLTFGDMFFKILAKKGIYANIYPNFWESVGFLIISMLIFLIFTPIIGSVLSNSSKDKESSSTTFVMSMIGPLFFILPILMYISYVLRIAKL